MWALFLEVLFFMLIVQVFIKVKRKLLAFRILWGRKKGKQKSTARINTLLLIKVLVL